MKYLKYKIEKISIEDKNYPKSLSLIKNPPKCLFYKGNPKILKNRKNIAIVGSRMMTNYGKSVVDKFVMSFVEQKIITISGFMYGVDTQVHKKTIEYGGQTIAVFGCGLNICYPPENEKLYDEILETGGVVLSEYTDNAKPHLWKFPQRNRIVSGLATLGVLVIEAGEKSGSLITAKLAKEQNKKVYAAPGPVTSSLSAGTNMLIKKGLARMVTDASDIIGHKREESSKSINLNSLESKILDSLKREGLSVDELAVFTGKSVIEVSSVLSLMSLKGIITEAGGKFYISK
jgi:DNA processing protein